MIPRPIYEALPFLYTGLGLASIMKIELVSGRISGALLFAAGVIIFTLRKEYRK